MTNVLTPLTQSFKLPAEFRNKEVIQFQISFQETKIRGSSTLMFEVLVEETSAEIPIQDKFQFESWQQFKSKFPQLNHFVREVLMNSPYWRPFGDVQRAYFVESICGHKGLYEITGPIVCSN